MYRGLAELAGLRGWRIQDAGGASAVDLASEKTCSRCGSAVRVCKTYRRRFVTLQYGEFVARVVRRRCSACRSLVRSQALEELAPKGQRYGYDVIVWVGLRRWMDRLQRNEIKSRLESSYGIHLSTGTISVLADRFLAYLGALHRNSVAALTREMTQGYVLHIDATTHQGRGGQFVCYDGWRRWILHAGRVEGERTEEIQPIVEQTVQWFGPPIAVVRDQSKACKAAVLPLVDAGVPDLLCHFHVLKNLGSQLLYRSCQRLKMRWKSLNAGTSLKDLLRSLRHCSTPSHLQLGAAVLWVLQGAKSRTSSFPFRVSILEQIDRLIALRDRLDEFVDIRQATPVSEQLEILQQLIADVADDADLATLCAKARQRQQVFNEVRDIFRLVDPGADPQPALPELQDQQIREIEDDLTRYRTALSRRLLRSTGDSRDALKTVINTLDRVKGQLFGHPVVRDNNGNTIFVVDRTNNAVEHFFSRQNQAMRRRTGRKNLGRDLEDLPAEAALVHNLSKPDYVRIVAGSLDQLPSRFASIRPLDTPLRHHSSNQFRQHLKSVFSQHSTLSNQVMQGAVAAKS